MNIYPITIHHLYISPGHNYFTHRHDDPGDHPTYDCDMVEIDAGQGIIGDRFYGRGVSFDGHVTFFSWEVFQLLRAEYSESVLSPMALRRNVIVEGVPLNQLLGHNFTIAGIEFHGAKHCAPCRWMDIAVAHGVLPILKGRGGLRAQALSGGQLRRGPAQLTTTVPLDLTKIAARLPRPNLP